ncbi:MAG: FtsW/RodA/SpoVE family cell cycle protein [Candidatus Colwellbacteria bacterium]|nr:FtsW/RodA/SpoVE family cell cycle protein [Candidatus Colwellbacteria bacterium]
MVARLLKKVDLPLLLAVFALILAGGLALGSSGGELFYRQLVWLVPSVLVLVFLPQANIKAILSYKWVIYGFYALILAMLVVTYFVAPTISGARSWIQLGGFQIQPSEFMKAALILLLSSFFAVRHVAIGRVRVILHSFVYFLIPVILILVQPDLGTALVLFGIWFGYLLLSEIKFKHLITALFILITIGALGWNFALADYQKARITALFSPEADPLGINYSVIQSKIAIGSGGIYGKGFGQGTQAHLGFLPAAHTDFVFSTFVEEWGLIGGLLVIGAFIYLVLRLLFLGEQSHSNFARFIALGTALMLMIHFTVNLGSATGLLPVIGVGLPFISYGGSNLLTVSLLVAIVQGITDKRARA